ncbi:MAG: transketolase family protein [Nitrospirae bacterium]|nr:transketolase family protein [Nitrospirota bacterium]
MSTKIATREAYGKALLELGKKNDKVVALDADLSGSTKTKVFGKEFPDRFFNVGIAEQNLIGTAAGLALGGKVPFASTFAVFATGRAWEQIRQSVCYPDLNVKVVASHAGITVGEDGGSHQSVEDIALMRVLPGMTVIVPADATETHKAVMAMDKHVGPAYIRVGREKVAVLFDDDYNFRIGRAHVFSKGKDVTFIACGVMVEVALKAAEELAAEGISAGVINMATIKPLDADAVIDAAKESGAIVTAEEHSVIGGLGGAVSELLGEEFPVPVKRVGMKDVFGSSGKPADLMKKYGLTSDDLKKAAKKAIAAKT